MKSYFDDQEIAKKYGEAQTEYAQRDQKADATLQQIVDSNGNQHASDVHVKVVFIDSVYSAGLSRVLGFNAHALAADILVDMADEIEAAIGQFKGTATFSHELATSLALVHGAIQATFVSHAPPGSKTPRSFLSKYLHFHAPAFPIYDSYAVSQLAAFVKRTRLKPVDGVDKEYFSYVHHFADLAVRMEKSGIATTPRGIDRMLWWYGYQEARGRTI